MTETDQFTPFRIHMQKRFGSCGPYRLGLAIGEAGLHWTAPSHYAERSIKMYETGHKQGKKNRATPTNPLIPIEAHPDCEHRTTRLLWCRMEIFRPGQNWWTEWKWMIGTYVGGGPASDVNCWMIQPPTVISREPIIGKEVKGYAPLPHDLPQ